MTISAIDMADINPHEIPANTPGTWQYRCISATAGNRSLTGAILLAALHLAAKSPPYISVKGGTITGHGFVLSNFVSKDGTAYKDHGICSVDQYVKAFRTLADHLKLSDEDRTELFVALKSWIVRDFRTSENGKGTMFA